MLLTLSQIRFLGRAPWSTATVLVGTMLGVASVVAVHLISVRVAESLADVTPPYLEEITFLIEKPALEMNDYFALRRSWRAAAKPADQQNPTTAALSAISRLTPIVEGRIDLAGRVVSVIGLDGLSGIEAALPLAALGPGGVLAGAGLELVKGERFSLGGADFEVVEVVAGLGDGLLLTEIGTAQALLGRPEGFVSRIGVRVEHPWLTARRVLDALLPGFAAGFPAVGWQLDGWQVRSLDSELPDRAFAESVLFNLGALGSLALVVAWLLVFQVAVIWLRRRRATMDILHLQGVTGAELRRGFLLSVSAIAAVATVLGTGIGWLLAALLARLTTSGLATDPGGEALVLSGWLLGKAAFCGVGVALVGAYLAFRQEWRPAAAPRPLTMALPLVVFALVGVAGLELTTALWGAFLAILAAGLATVFAVRPVLGLLRVRLQRPRRRRLLWHVGARELVWYPRDLAIAIGALALAVATSVAIGVMVSSFRGEFADMLEQRLAHDVFARADGSSLAPLAASLRAREDVTGVSAYGRTAARVDGAVVELGYTDFTVAETRRYGWPAALADGDALASERLLRQLDLDPGDRVTVMVDAAAVELRVVAGFPGFGDAVPRLLVPLAAARALGITPRFDRLSIYSEAPRGVYEHLVATRGDLEVQLAGPLRALALQIFDRTFAITRALTLVALLVAGLGLYNALLALRLNQQPAERLLTSMGVGRHELRVLELGRAVGVGLTTLVFAAPLGLLMSWLLCAEVNPRAFGWSLTMDVTLQAVATPLLLGAGVIALVALLPAPKEKLGA